LRKSRNYNHQIKGVSMNKSIFTVLCGLPVLGSSAAPAIVPAVKPNIILILADDMGYADASCFGGKAVATPNIDALATSGLRMTRFYAASAVCTPTRASILTGRYPLRFGIQGIFVDRLAHLPRGIVTLPGLLQNAGYSTAHVGKWHVGGLQIKDVRDRSHSAPGPLQHGFEQYLCQIEDNPSLRLTMVRDGMYRHGGTILWRNDKPVDPFDPYYTAHWTDIIGDEAVRLVDELHRKGKPFFINVWHLVPHKPYEPGVEPYYSQTAAPGITEPQHVFRSMMAHMDAKVGELVAKLDQLGIRDNTLIVFTSDNGGIYEGDNGPFRAGKADLHEGGIRVPMIASWPRKIPAGSTSGTIGSTVDLLPTFCSAAGVAVPAEANVDGINLLDHWMGGPAVADRKPLFWRLGPVYGVQRYTPDPGPKSTEAAVQGQWKLLTRDGVPQELFDLDSDPGETRNLLNEHPELAGKMAQQIRSFLADPRDNSGLTDPELPKIWGVQ
jgi:arylsulfatase A-like enzyme